MSIISSNGGDSSDETKQAVSGWKSMKNGGRMSRRERIAQERANKANEIDPENVTPEMKRQLMKEAAEAAENALENPMRHLKEAYKNKRQVDMNKRQAKLDPTKALLLLTEVSEKGGKIISVAEAGFNQFLIEYVL